MTVKRLAILLVSWLLMWPNLVFAKKTVVLATTHWAPYVRDDGAYKGYVFEIVKAAFLHQGYEVKIYFLPWARGLAMARDGVVDGIFPEYDAPEKDKYFVYSMSFSGGPLGLYKRANSGIHINIRNPKHNQTELFKSLRKYRFGVVTGYANTDAFDNNDSLTKIPAKSDQDNMRHLYEGMVDLVFIDKHVADHLLQHELPDEYRDKLLFLPPALGEKKLYLGISKKNPHYRQLLKAFNRGLIQIRRDGTLFKILDRDARMTREVIA